MNDGERIKRIGAMLDELRKKAYVRFGRCATGLRDYHHSHSWASDCSQCVERGEAERMVTMLEVALGLTPDEIPCFVTDDTEFCIPHKRAVRKCRKK